MFSWWFVQALASVRVQMRIEQAVAGPCPNRSRRDAKSLGHLLLREKPPVTQAVVTALEGRVVFDEIKDHLPRKESPIAGAMPVLVEDRRNAAGRVRLKQRIDLGQHRRARLLQFPCAQRDGEGERSRTAAAEAHLCRDGLASSHCDIFDQQPDHALSLAWRCFRITPQPREIGSQCQHTRALFGSERRSIGGVLPVTAFLCVLERTQLRIPVRFEPVGHQAVVRVDVHEPLTGEVGFVLRPLHLHLPQTACFRQVGLDLVLDGERHL
jgi:hypothetical protein